MANASTKDKMEFAYLMAKHSKATQSDIQRLMRYGSTYSRFATDACNRQLTTREEQRWHSIRGKINILCNTFDASVKFQNDPRGCTVKIVVPDGYTNDWGREGICVPTS
jgi:hypothetical protein